MSRYRSKLVHAALALVLLVISAVLWPSLGASTAYAACTPTPINDACITNSPSVVATLDGHDHIVPYNLLFTLNHSTGIGDWHVTIALTQFTTASVPHRTLPAASTITAVSVQSACTLTCPNNTIGYSLSVTAGNPAVTFYDNNGVGTNGVGTFSIQAMTNVMVPGNAYAGTYTSTITIAFVSGSP